MRFFVVNNIMWLIQQICDHASNNTRELVEMVSVGNGGARSTGCALSASLTLMPSTGLEILLLLNQLKTGWVRT